MSHPSPRARILVVDDAPVVCEALQWVIEDTPDLQMVGQARGGLEAVVRTAALEPDIVVLDVHLPGLDGYAVARELKSMPNPPIIVFLSIDTDIEAQRRAREAGGDAFVAKAQGWEVLLAQIRKVLSARK
jgi:DNA-binding NarL/FixJ family response regulator